MTIMNYCESCRAEHTYTIKKVTLRESEITSENCNE